MKTEDQKPKQWGPAVAIIGTIVMFLGAQIIAGLVVSIYPALKHWSAIRTNDWFDNSIWAQFFLVASVEILTLLLLRELLKRYKATLKSLGLRWPMARDVAYAAAAFLPYILVTAVLVSVVEGLVPAIKLNQTQDIGFTGATGASLILVFCSLVILPAITEELLIRGFLYMGLKSKLPTIQAALVTSLIFASAHLQFGNGKPLVWSAAVDTFVLSLVLIYLREKTGSLAASISLHMIKNTVAFISLFLIIK